ncbi:DUF5320 domain-containing protein [uncultured Draconibacterium sp.]|uniref:DUF5320 domain-containing protein n=1 Tax=uncultured Draconibacterium sp. TaxID=1573823 RepID=UPI003217AC00
MPGLDKTGPMGQGSQTGRKNGRCSTDNDTTLEYPMRGRRNGRGFRHRGNMENEAEEGFRGGRGNGWRGLRRGRNL